jgi:predicted ester cyclase
MSDENKWMVRCIYEAMCNQQNLAFAADHFAGDFLGHSTTEYRGPEGQLKRFATLFDALRDCEFTIQDQIAEGDKVVTRWLARGMQIGEFEGLHPTGEMATITGIDILRVAHGKIIEGWSNANRQGVTVTHQQRWKRSTAHE